MKHRILYTAVASVALGLTAVASAQSVWTPTTTPNNWEDAANWTGGVPNATGAVATVGTNIGAISLVNLNSTITVGSLTLGDPTTPFFGFNLTQGTTGGTGSLVFQATTGNATLTKTAANTANDIISVPVALNSTLEIRPNAGAGATLTFSNAMSGSGGLVLKGTATASLGTVSLVSKLNTYAGTTTIENGNLQFRGSLPNDGVTASGLGISSTAIVIGNANTPNNAATAVSLQLISDIDNGAYTISRGLDFSASLASSQFLFQANANTVADTGSVTLAGPITINAARNTQFAANRAGMRINFDGLITSSASNASVGRLVIGASSSGAVNADGPAAPATYRFSNQNNTFVNHIILWNGNVVIAGNVPAIGSPSPIGVGGGNNQTTAFNMSDGNGGNILNGFLGANVSGGASGSVRAVFMETGGTTFARNIVASGGTGSSYANYNNGGPNGGGINVNVNVINGYAFGQATTGATNLAQEVTWSGNIAIGVQQVGASNSVDFPRANKMLIPGNLALLSANGGTVNFSGTITEQSGGVISTATSVVTGGVTSNGYTTGSSSATRVTINQFRNNPYIDNNNDGIADTVGVTGSLANEWIGTPTTGTVKITGTNQAWTGTTDIRGGAFLINSRLFTGPNGTISGTGSTVTVWSGATIGGTGRLFAGLTGTPLVVDGTVNPGDPTSLATSTASVFTVDKPVNFRTGSTLVLDINSGSPFQAGPTDPRQDRLSLGTTSSLTLDSGANLVVNLGYLPGIGGVHNVIDNTGTTSVTGTFSGLAEGAIIEKTFAGQFVRLAVSYVGNTGNDVTLTAVTTTSSYSGGALGTWAQTGNWTSVPAGAVYPNGPGFTAVLGSGATGPTVVALDSVANISNLQFNSTNSYTISGAGSLVMNRAIAGSNAVVDVLAGDHTVAVPIAFTSNATVNVLAGSSLTLLSGVTATGTVTTNLDGELFFAGTTAGTTANLGSVFGNGAGELSVASGTLNLARTRGPKLTITGGTTKVATGGAVSWTTALTIDSSANGGFLDITDGGLVAFGGNVAAIRAAVAAWYNGGTRDGKGLGSTSASAAGFTTLAVFPNNADGFAYYEGWSGLTLFSDTVLVRYTYLGDTNIDGVVDGKDLTAFLEGYTTGLTGWQNGDFNYDGVINVQDYQILTASLGAGLAPLPGGPAGVDDGGTGAVPEPTGAALIGVVAAAGLGRRRRATVSVG